MAHLVKFASPRLEYQNPNQLESIFKKAKRAPVLSDALFLPYYPMTNGDITTKLLVRADVFYCAGGGSDQVAYFDIGTHVLSA